MDVEKTCVKGQKVTRKSHTKSSKFVSVQEECFFLSTFPPYNSPTSPPLPPPIHPSDLVVDGRIGSGVVCVPVVEAEVWVVR